MWLHSLCLKPITIVYKSKTCVCQRNSGCINRQVKVVSSGKQWSWWYIFVHKRQAMVLLVFAFYHDFNAWMNPIYELCCLLVCCINWILSLLVWEIENWIEATFPARFNYDTPWLGSLSGGSKVTFGTFKRGLFTLFISSQTSVLYLRL